MSRGNFGKKNNVYTLHKTDFTPVKSITSWNKGRYYFYLILDDNGHLYRKILENDYFEKISFDFLIRDVSIIRSYGGYIYIMILSRDFKIYLSTIYMNNIIPTTMHHPIPENIHRLKNNFAISENIENLYSIDHNGKTTYIVTYIQSNNDFCDKKSCCVLFFINGDNNLVLYKLQRRHVCFGLQPTGLNPTYMKSLLHFDNICFEHIYGLVDINLTTTVRIVTDTNGLGYIFKKNDYHNISNCEGFYSYDKKYVVYKMNIENPIVSVEGLYISTKNEIFKFDIVLCILSISNVTAEFICDGLTSVAITGISQDVFINPKPGRFTKSAKI